MLKSIEIILGKWSLFEFTKFLKCTDLRTTPFDQYSTDIDLCTTPIYQYFLGVDIFFKWPNRVELAL